MPWAFWMINYGAKGVQWMNDGRVLSYPQPFIPLWNILRIFWYVAYVWNNFQQFCFQKYSGNMWASCWKISRYMLRVSKLNIAETWWCLAPFVLHMPVSRWDRCIVFPPWRRHPTLHPTQHIPKLHQTTLKIILGEIPQNIIIPGSLLKLFPTFSFFTLFLPCSFHVLPKNSRFRWPCVGGVRQGKKRLVVTCFVMFCPVSGLGLWMLPAFFEGFRTSHIPLE